MFRYINTLIFILTVIFARQAVAEDWDILSDEDNNIVGVRNVEKLLGEFLQFSVLEGFIPKGKDLGYKKMAGSRIRNFIYMCGEPAASLLSTVVHDTQMDLLMEDNVDSLKSAPMIARDSDPALMRVTRYVCGDKTAKSAHQLETQRKKPKDSVTLICNFDEGKGDFVVWFSESEKLANNFAAEIDEDYITFNLPKAQTVRINRNSGKFTTKSEEDDITLTGKCSVNSKQEF